MAESVNAGKEMSMETRLLLALLLMGAVLFVTQLFIKTPPPETLHKTTPATATAPVEKTPAAAESAPAAADTAVVQTAPTSPATRQQTLPPLVIDTDLFKLTFTNQGATVRTWELKKYKDNNGHLLNLVNTASGLEPPFSLYFPEQKPASNVNWAWYKQTVDPDGLGVTYDYSDGHTSVKKVFRFQKNSYLCTVSAEASVDGKPIPNMLQWRGGFGDLTIASPASTQKTLFFDVSNNKLNELTARSAKNGPVTSSGNFSFAGIADTYFAAVFLPRGDVTTHLVTFPDTVPIPLPPGEKPQADSKPPAQTLVGMAVSDGADNRFELFVGPKDVNLLKSINPKLEQVVDFGWMSILAKPLFLLVNWFNGAFIHNFGWSIVIVTIALNMILFPIKLSNMKSMRKMQALKPQIDAINAKYKNLKMTDPRKAEQQQETMDLYKKHGVNPMGGCFPMLLQIPFFFAFYKVFTVSVEMRGANWLWVNDLSQPEHIAIRILPIIMIATQFLMQRMTPQPNADPNQQRMMMMMPLIFGFMFYNFPSGLVLYYLTSNLVGMGQQWFFNHTETAQEAARSVGPPPKKKNGRK
jgi:YidC/Oxa1 family membrane protein insertase